MFCSCWLYESQSDGCCQQWQWASVVFHLPNRPVVNSCFSFDKMMTSRGTIQCVIDIYIASFSGMWYFCSHLVLNSNPNQLCSFSFLHDLVVSKQHEFPCHLLPWCVMLWPVQLDEFVKFRYIVMMHGISCATGYSCMFSCIALDVGGHCSCSCSREPYL